MPSTIDLNQSDPVAGDADSFVPVINARELFNPTDKTLINTVRTACLETGFFYVQPIPVQEQIVDNTLHQMEKFFAIDDTDSRKTDIQQVDGRRGWQPKFTEPAYQSGTIASVEAYDFGSSEITSGGPYWPTIQGFQRDVTACWNMNLQIADRILEIIAQAAGIETDFLKARCQKRTTTSMRLLHYAGDALEYAESNVGISAHTDFECITLIFQNAPGLELRTIDGRWLDAESGTGRIIVMLDDMLERWTNGHFKATGHRVRQTNEQRFSIVMFVAVDNTYTIAPLQEFVTDAAPALYAPTSQEKHIENEIRRSRENAELP